MHTAMTPWLRLVRPATRRGAWMVPAQTQTHSLDKGATLALPKPRGVTVQCRRGSLWLTHDGDCRDVVLSAGERYVSTDGRRLLVHALDEAVALVTRQ